MLTSKFRSVNPQNLNTRTPACCLTQSPVLTTVKNESETVHLDDSPGKLPRRFLRQVVPDAAPGDPVRVFA